MDAPQFSTSHRANKLTAKLLRVVITLWLAVLLRWLLIKLYEPGFYLAELGDWALAYYLFPVLIVLTLALIFVAPLILWRTGRALSRAGLFLLPVVAVNAILRLLDLRRMNAICEDEYIRYETVCDDLYLQAFCSVPFLFAAGIILLAGPRQR